MNWKILRLSILKCLLHFFLKNQLLFSNHKIAKINQISQMEKIILTITWTTIIRISKIRMLKTTEIFKITKQEINLQEATQFSVIEEILLNPLFKEIILNPDLFSAIVTLILFHDQWMSNATSKIINSLWEEILLWLKINKILQCLGSIINQIIIKAIKALLVLHLIKEKDHKVEI